MNGLDHTNCPKVSELTYLGAAHVTHSSHRWWPSLLLLSRFVKIFPTIPLVSLLEFWCVSEVFVILYFICSLSFLLIKPYVFQILQLERVANDIYDLWIVDIIYDSINNIIFLNILLNYIFFIIFFSFRMFETKKT